MKSGLTYLTITAITLIAIFTSFFILDQKNSERKKYEQFLLEQGKKMDVPATGDATEESSKSPDEPQMAAFQDYLQTMDPAEQRVPAERLHKAYREMQAAENTGNLKTTDPLQWNIVSSNMGGRTRVIMYDPNDASGNKVWAGGVTGGLWYNNNITGQSWVPVGDFWPSLAISSITYDPNDPEVFYVGTGEAFTSRVIYRESSGIGAGIFKSSNGGDTWEQLPSTLNWKYVTDIEVRNENGNSVIYAGVASGEYHGSQQSEPSDGLFRSIDGGMNWTQVMPDIDGTDHPYPVADIEITAGNRLIVGTMPNLSHEGGSTILYSDQGIAGTWTIYDNYVAIIESNPDLYITNRVMLGSAPSDPDVVYALLDAGYINSSNGFVYTQGIYILRSDNAGQTWVSKPIPTGGEYYWATIGWHALTLGVDPNNADALYIGGLDVYKSIDGANSWEQVSDWRYMYYGGGDLYVHADIHDIDYKPGSSDELLVTSDGGVFYTSEASQSGPAFQEKNNGFGTLQFYSCAIHPNAGSNRYVGGLQDNGTLYHTGSPLTIFDMIDGGDGAYCFIDQNQPQYMITSVYYNQYTLWNNGNYYESMSDWQSGTFVCPADYDYRSNILFANACSFGGSQANRLLRIKGIPDDISGSYINLNTGLSVYYTAVEYSRHSASNTSTLFVGALSGQLYKVTNAQATPQVTEITGPDFPLGAVSSIAVGSTENTLLVTFSNYGVSSVWMTTDGGANWVEKESNLPDMPVRWAMFHPASDAHAMLATELGVWTTQNLNEENTLWVQDIEGLANVRVDMLQMRTSDYTVIAATHGRGLATAVWDIGVGVGDADPEAAGQGDVEVFPNPARGKVEIKLSGDNGQWESVELIGLNGKSLQLWNAETRVLDLTGYPAGIYFIRLNSQEQTVSKKIFKR